MGALVNNKAINLLFSFKGRVPRKTYWLYIIACITVGVFPFLSFVNMDREERELYINIVGVLFIWPSIAIQVKRWHDIDSSGAWFLVNFVPVIGGLWALIANGFIRGTNGDNFYGQDPYANESQR
jgi:uncharacterized membrane protein YhaH (DUF805 family)